MSLEWDWSSSHWNDRDGLGMTGLDQERRDEEVSQEVIRVSIPVILAPSRHSGIIRKSKNNGDDPRMRVEWDQAQGLSWQLSLSWWSHNHKHMSGKILYFYFCHLSSESNLGLNQIFVSAFPVVTDGNWERGKRFTRFSFSSSHIPAFARKKKNILQD